MRSEADRMMDDADTVVDQASPPRPVNPRELQRFVLAGRAGKPFISYRDSTGELALLTLDGNELLIGRNPGCGIVVDWDARVSRVHCALTSAASEWTVEDDGLSSNGTFLNGLPLQGRRRLRDADLLRVGHTLLLFSDPAEAQDGQDATELGGARIPGLEQLSDAERQVLVALCRPICDDPAATPATNAEISAEVYLGIDAVKKHLRHLFARLDLGSVPQREKRARLAQIVLESGLITERDLDRPGG